MQGGIGSGYKKLIEEKGAMGETYTTEGIALIRVSETSIYNNKTLQVDAVLPISFYQMLMIFFSIEGSLIYKYNVLVWCGILGQIGSTFTTFEIQLLIL